jgi:hypothetical protein
MPTTVWINSIIRSISFRGRSQGALRKTVRKLYKARSNAAKLSGDCLLTDHQNAFGNLTLHSLLADLREAVHLAACTTPV